MKKYLIFGFLLLTLFLTGCSKGGEKDVIRDLEKKVGNAKAYQVQGVLEISNNDDTYHYDVIAAYKHKDQYRVSLKNKANNHEQIILKNKEGVYVLTPSLNKSFKFQSDWPYNNSQVYLLQSIINDIKKDDKSNFIQSNNDYIFTTKVNYPNNKKLIKQKILLDKNLNFKEVVVLDEADIPQMKMTFSSVDLKPTFDDMYFDLNETMKTCATCGNVEETKESSSINDIIFPLYLPAGTKLTSQDRINKSDGERIILTFAGEKPFLLVEENTSVSKEMAVVPTYGEPYLLIDTVGALSDNSISWTSGGIDYYIVSDVMSQDEL
ncbi:MAG: outer membrane lipoprotein carrier protein LolA, partial [Bacilli bacterium]